METVSQPIFPAHFPITFRQTLAPIRSSISGRVHSGWPTPWRAPASGDPDSITRGWPGHREELQTRTTAPGRHLSTREFSLHVQHRRPGSSGPGLFPTEKLQHVHDAALHHERSINQLAYSAE